MNEYLESLGRRWVALGLEWMPRMVALPGDGGLHPELGRVVVDEVVGGVPWRWHYERALHFSVWRQWEVDFPAAVPDFADKLTELALLHYVQQAWADPRAYVLPLAGLHTDGRWTVAGNHPAGVLERMAPEGYPTWAEACIAALEASAAAVEHGGKP